jgi:hypothetical protein
LTVIKSIVVGLALANACYFLWAHGIADSEQTTTVPASGSTLRLASEAPAPTESSGARPARAAAAEPVNTDSPGLLTHVMRCITVGPFRDVSEAAHAASSLRTARYDPRQRVVDGEVWAGVWVYLPIPVGRASAEQMLAKLKAAGIDDAMEMPGPADASVISLGLFSEQKRAEVRVAQTQALGFNPAIADRKRTGNVYWIDIDLKPTDGLPNASDLVSESGRITRLEVKACPAAAGAPT